MKGIVGIDPGLTSLGLVRVDVESSAVYHNAIGTKTDIPIWERYQHTMHAIAAVVKPGDAIFMEDYAFGVKANVSSLTQLAEIGSLIKMTCHQKAGCWPFPVGITSLKKFMSGKGRGIKYEDLKLSLYKSHRLEFKTSDEVVAFGLVQFGMCLLGYESNPPKKSILPGWRGYELETTKAYWKRAVKSGIVERLQTFAINS